MRAASPSLLALLVAACAPEAPPPVCGNGAIEEGESCDKGDKNGMPGIACDVQCRAITVLLPQINLNWGLLKKTGVAGYGGTNCDAVGAESARVVITGPSSIEETLPCRNYGKIFAEVCTVTDGGTRNCDGRLAAGQYQAEVTLLAGDGTPLTQAVSSEKKQVSPGPAVPLVVDFETRDFLGAYTGSLFLELSWGAEKTSCDAATPPVARESLWIARPGELKSLVGATAPPAGTPLDGTPAACYPPRGGGALEEAPGIPWGPYQLVVQGFGAGALPIYCGRFDVFTGPGNNGQIWKLTVPAAATSGDGGAADGGAGCP